MRNALTASLALSLVSLVGCDWNEVETGDHGVFTFTPDNCGNNVCDLDDDFVVGGTAKVTLDSVDDYYDVDGVELVSSNPNVFQVEPTYLGSLWSEWLVTGIGAGSADLIAVDYAGYEIDHTTIHVDWADRLGLESRYGDAVGPRADGTYDQIWTVNAYEAVGFQVEAIGGGQEMMGIVAYDVDIDEALLAGLTEGSELTGGELEFSVPPGAYDVRFTAPDGTTMNVLFQAQ